MQIVDENGNIVNEYEYDEWGNILSEKEEIKNPIKYAGEYYGKESGHYYLRARYYDPTIGRFISEDSYKGSVTNPLSLNLYTYYYNNPIIYNDPRGHVVNPHMTELGDDYKKRQEQATKDVKKLFDSRFLDKVKKTVY